MTTTPAATPDAAAAVVVAVAAAADHAWPRNANDERDDKVDHTYLKEDPVADDAKKPTDSDALAEVLRNAQLGIEAAVTNLRDTGLLSAVDLRGFSRRALEDNNSSCNTACSCGQPRQAEQLQR